MYGIYFNNFDKLKLEDVLKCFLFVVFDSSKQGSVKVFDYHKQVI